MRARRAMIGGLASLLAVGCPSEAPAPGTPPLPPTTREVGFEGEGLTLEGTLHMPQRELDGLVPAVVLVHGSGPNSRDEVSTGQLNMSFGGIEFPVFGDIAEHLQSAGVAVLRYDKRSCGPFNGLCDNDYPSPSPDLLVSDFLDDAAAAGAWLMGQEGIDPGRVFVVGHSQGAASMPAILSRDAGFAGGVSLAGNWRPVDVLLRYQLDFSIELLEELGSTQEQIDQAVGSLRAMVEDVEALRAGTFPGTSIGGLPNAFWQDWMAIGDARPGLVAAESRPMLAVNGDYDWNIPVDPELGLWAAAGVETLELRCITHGLNCVSNEDWTTIAPSDIGTGVAPAVLGALTGWLLAQ
jgi:pimeloyl-ACP methyl ester carboxylesterase